MLRMCTCPPIARDRLIGLANVNANMIKTMELRGIVPPRMNLQILHSELKKAGDIIVKMADRDIFTWLDTSCAPNEFERRRATSIIADRLCGAVSDPIIRNAQEQRQLNKIKRWLENRGYRELESG